MSTNQVEIEIIAKDIASQVLDVIIEKLKSTGTVTGLVAAGFVTAGVAIAGTLIKMGDEASNYAAKVQDVQHVTGQTAEEASRMVSVFDRLGVKTESLRAVATKLQKDGLAPTLDTLEKLSDQYLALTTAEEKNSFVVDKLGRSGFQYVDILEKGSAAIKAMSASTADGLILTQKQVDLAESARINQEQLNQTMDQYKILIGNEVIPVQNELVNQLLDFVDMTRLAEEHGQNWFLLTNAQQGAYFQEARAAREAAMSGRDHSEALDGVASSADDATGALGKLTDAEKAENEANTTLLSNMTSLQSAEETYGNTIERNAQRAQDINANMIQGGMKEQEILQKIRDLQAETVRGHDAKAKKQEQLTSLQLQYNAAVAGQLKLQDQLKQVDEDNIKAAEDKQKAGNQLIFNMLQQKAAADGIVDSHEEEFLQNTAVKLGLVSQESATAAIKASQLADAMWDGFTKANPPMTITADLMDRIASHNGEVVTMQVILETLGLPVPGANSTLPTPPKSGPNAPIPPMAFGGDVYPGGSYLVGERGPELFRPMVSGTIVPTDKMKGAGGTVNINITGLLTTQMLDYLAQETRRRIT